MSEWKLIRPSLIAGIHSLRGAQNFRNLRLSQIVILPDPTQTL